MIVEFVGPSGGGKSTLYSSVEEELKNQRVTVCRPLELVLGSRGTSLIRTDTIANVVLDFFYFPWILLGLLKYRQLMKVSWQELSRRVPSLLPRLLLLRSVARRVGQGLYLRRRKFDRKVVLVDEGCVHIAHVIYVNGVATDDPVDLENFIRLVPAPDLLVYVSAPDEVLTDRVIARSDQPIRSDDDDELRSFVLRASALFDRLIFHWKTQNSLISVYFNNEEGQVLREEAQAVVYRVSELLKL